MEVEAGRVVAVVVPEVGVHGRVAVHEWVLETGQKHNYFAEI